MLPKVLVVEDEYAIQETLKTYLETKYSVIVASTAKEAVKHIREVTFKVMIVDLGLPDGSGVDVIKNAAKNQKKSVVLALTGDKSTESVKLSIQAGVDDYLVKPVGPMELHDRIDRAALKRIMAK